MAAMAEGIEAAPRRTARWAWLAVQVDGRSVRSWIVIGLVIALVTLETGILFVHGFGWVPGGIGAMGPSMAQGVATPGMMSVMAQEARAGAPVDRVTLADQRAYWFARYNVNALLLMSGLGEPLPMTEQQLRRAAEASALDFGLVPKHLIFLSGVYESGQLYFTRPGDFTDLATLRWDPSTMNRTLTPKVQGLTIANIFARGYRERLHDTAKDRFIARGQVAEARAMTERLEGQLKGADGLYRGVRPDGRALEPTALDQLFVLWGYTRAAQSTADAHLPSVYDEGLSQRYRALAAQAFAASRRLPPTSTEEQALALEAYADYARIGGDRAARAAAADLAERLSGAPSAGVTADALRLRALARAGTLLGERGWTTAATRILREQLEPAWNPRAGTYDWVSADSELVYTPLDAGAVLGALQAFRTSPQAPLEVRELATRRFAEAFDAVVVRSGMQFAEARPLAVAPGYQWVYPKAYFTAPSIPLSVQAGGPRGFGGCPMFQRQVTFTDGQWRVSATGQYAAYPGLFLALMLWNE